MMGSIILAEIAAVAGEDAAIKIAQARGGTQVYFPPEPAKDHWLCELIGQEKAQAVCEQLTCGVGPRRVDVPLGGTGHAGQGRARVDAMLNEQAQSADGKPSERDIAMATGYSMNGVRKRKAKLKLPKDTRQSSLF